MNATLTEDERKELEGSGFQKSQLFSATRKKLLETMQHSYAIANANADVKRINTKKRGDSSEKMAFSGPQFDALVETKMEFQRKKHTLDNWFPPQWMAFYFLGNVNDNPDMTGANILSTFCVY